MKTINAGPYSHGLYLVSILTNSVKHLTENEAQGGCSMAEADQLISLATSAGLEVTGLMAIGPQGDVASIRSATTRYRCSIHTGQ